MAPTRRLARIAGRIALAWTWSLAAGVGCGEVAGLGNPPVVEPLDAEIRMDAARPADAGADARLDADGEAREPQDAADDDTTANVDASIAQIAPPAAQ